MTIRTQALLTLLFVLTGPSLLLGQRQLSQADKEQLTREIANDHVQIKASARFRKNSSIIAITKMFQGSSPDEFMKFLELTDGQKQDLEEMHEEFLSDLKAIDEQTEVQPSFRGDLERQIASDKSKRSKEFIAAIEEVLLPHQMEAFSELDIRRVGPIKVAVHPVIEERLELTERQKERIKERSDEIAKEIFEFVHKKRQEAFDVLQDELSEKQFEKFETIYSPNGKSLDTYFDEAPMSSLYRKLQFTRRKDEEAGRHALEYLMKSELKRKEFKK